MNLMQYQIPNYIAIYVLVTSVSLLIFVFLALRGKRTMDKTTPRRVRLFVFAGAIFAWFGLQLFLSSRGFHAQVRIMPPILLVMVVAGLALFLWIGFRPAILSRLREIGVAGLTVFQTWRFIPEVLILLLIRENLMPSLMTFTGRNLDILAPLTAAPLAYLCVRKKIPARPSLIIWNILAMIILTTTVTHGILSAPFPFRVFETAPPNIAVLLFPTVLLPLFMVPLAFTVHILSLKLLLENGNHNGEYLTGRPPE